MAAVERKYPCVLYSPDETVQSPLPDDIWYETIIPFMSIGSLLVTSQTCKALYQMTHPHLVLLDFRVSAITRDIRVSFAEREHITAILRVLARMDLPLGTELARFSCPPVTPIQLDFPLYNMACRVMRAQELREAERGGNRVNGVCSFGTWVTLDVSRMHNPTETPYRFLAIYRNVSRPAQLQMQRGWPQGVNANFQLHAIINHRNKVVLANPSEDGEIMLQWYVERVSTTPLCLVCHSNTRDRSRDSPNTIVITCHKCAYYGRVASFKQMSYVRAKLKHWDSMPMENKYRLTVPEPQMSFG